MAEDDSSDRYFSWSSCCRMHAIHTEIPFPLCVNSFAGFARKERFRDSRFSNPLARPNTIFYIIGDAHDATVLSVSLLAALNERQSVEIPKQFDRRQFTRLKTNNPAFGRPVFAQFLGQPTEQQYVGIWGHKLGEHQLPGLVAKRAAARRRL